MVLGMDRNMVHNMVLARSRHMDCNMVLSMDHNMALVEERNRALDDNMVRDTLFSFRNIFGVNHCNISFRSVLCCNRNSYYYTFNITIAYLNISTNGDFCWSQ